MFGTAMGGVIQKLSAGHQAAVNQVNRRAYDSDFVDRVLETTRSVGRYEKPASFCVAWNAASYRHYRRFIEKIEAASVAASWRTGRGNIGSKGEKRCL